MIDLTTSVDIEAPREVVFDYLVTPEGMLAWLGQRAELEPISGGVFSVDIDGNLIRGEYLEVDPPNKVVITWGLLGSEQLPAGSSRVEFLLTETPTGTHLDLTHSDLPESQKADHLVGWNHLLAVLVAEAKKGTA